jgi:hypothetical protein
MSRPWTIGFDDNTTGPHGVERSRGGDYYLKGQLKKIGPSKQLAELALKDVELKIARGEYLGIYEEKKLTFRQFVPEYLGYSQAKKAAALTGAIESRSSIG